MGSHTSEFPLLHNLLLLYQLESAAAWNYLTMSLQDTCVQCRCAASAAGAAATAHTQPARCVISL